MVKMLLTDELLVGEAIFRCSNEAARQFGHFKFHIIVIIHFFAN